jgi:hypothetical protein
MMVIFEKELEESHLLAKFRKIIQATKVECDLTFVDLNMSQN